LGKAAASSCRNITTMMIDRIAAMLNELDGSELDKMRPADRRRFAALCHHWAQLAEIRDRKPTSDAEVQRTVDAAREAAEPAGVLARLRSGERAS
jgi:hypothetical protein